MDINNNNSADELHLLRVIKSLNVTKIRSPMTFEQTKAWLNQFEKGAEKTLALLILRFLIYRTSDQLKSSLKQAFKDAATSFAPHDNTLCVDWRAVLEGKVAGLAFSYGPAKQDDTRPGKSGEVISRLLKHCIPLDGSQLIYPNASTILNKNQRYLLVDDGIYTGTQLSTFLQAEGNFMVGNGQSAIVVGFAHEDAIKNLGNRFPSVPIFYGEKITAKECFKALSEDWVKNGLWQYSNISPLDQYHLIVERNFDSAVSNPLGFGDLGCMIAYDHGIPDNSLQLLWDKSDSWNPLFER
ncbi:MAG TPA: hypothetical protein PL131_13230 [Methylotenera sp.]|nr:hypothetical protein [Methylotenera sp.]